MSFGFRWFAKPVRIVRKRPGQRVREWQAKMLEMNQYALIESGTDIQIGDEVSDISTFGKIRSNTRRTVGHVDWTSRVSWDQGVITWVGGPPRASYTEVNMEFDIETMAIRLLDWLAKKPLTNSFISIEPFVADNNLPPFSIWPLRDYLTNRGLVRDASGLNSVDVAITSEGLAFISEVRTQRSDPTNRAQHLRKFMLRWLYEKSPNEPPHDWSAFYTDWRFFYLGESYTSDEVAREAEYLSDRGLISGLAIEEAGPASIYPRLTSDGRDCVTEHGGNVSTFLNRHQPANNTNVYMTGVQGNTVIASNNVVQNVEGGLDMRAMLDFAGFVRQVASTLGLADEERENMTSAAEALHEDASSSSPEPGRLRRLINSIMEGLTKAAPTVVSSTAIQMGEQALKAIGG